MTLCCELTVSVEFLMKSGKVINVSQTESIEYDGDGKEYSMLCKEHDAEIGFDRDSDENRYDKMLMELVGKNLKDAIREKINKIIDTYRTSIFYNTKTVIELFGWIFNANDISGMHIVGYNTRVSKREE